ncbi:MAG: hypothetical protein KDD61_15230, partial [Bdellovibrionales bacterium]|nr:hypothetical protein [Bdellovibrionales bacterium]
MILFLKGSTFKLPALAVVTAILAVACSPAEHHRKVLDTSFLNLGKAGEVKSASNIPEAEHLVVLSKNQTLRFMDDAGLVEIDPINKKLEPGQIIVGNESEPTLLEVIKVVSENGSNVQVQTKLAKASQLSKDNEASFSYEATPEISSEGAFETTGSIKINDDAVIELEDVEFYSFTAESKGRISKSVNVFGKLKRDHQFDVQSLDQGDFKAVIKKGKLKLIPTFRSQAQFSWGKPKKIDSQIDALLQYEFEIEFSYTGKGNFTVTTDIIPKQKIPVRIPGPVPVFVDIEMQVPAGIKFSSQAGGSLTVKYEGSYAFASKLTYDPKSGVNKVVQQDFTTDQMIVKRPENEASVSAEFFLEPKVMSRLYRVLGPYAYLHPYIKGQVLFPLKRHQDDLFMGITGGVGLQVSEPVFQSELLNLKSGSLFNVYQSWDLVAPLPVAPKAEGVEKTLANKKQEAFTVSSLTPEGFVVIHLKDKTDERLLNFRLIQGTTRGLLVPADSFASTGKVYYFPLMKDAAQAEDQFSYYISDGKTVGEPQTVKLTVSPAIIEGLKKPRFSITSNSVKMSFSGPSQNEDKVPHFRVGEELRSAYVHVNANVPPVEAILLASGLEVSKVPNAFSVSTNRQVKVG